MVVPYILCAALVCVVVYLAWMYYFLFHKEKQKNPRLEALYGLNQDIYIPKPKRKPTTGKFAIAGLLVAPFLKNKNHKVNIIQSNKDDALSKPDTNKTEDGIGNVVFTESENGKSPEVTKVDTSTGSSSVRVEEEKDMHFENETSRHSFTCRGPEITESDQGYGTLSASAKEGNGSYFSDV